MEQVEKEKTRKSYQEDQKADIASGFKTNRNKYFLGCLTIPEDSSLLEPVRFTEPLHKTLNKSTHFEKMQSEKKVAYCIAAYF